MVNSFIKSQFSYCPLKWMFTAKGCNNRIERVHESFLRLIFNDYETLLYNMISTIDEKTVRQRCIKVLLTEVFKYLNGYSPELMNEILRQNHCATYNPSQKFMFNSTVYWANQLWQTLPSEVNYVL